MNAAQGFSPESHPEGHIVDQLIAERAPRLMNRPSTRRLLYQWLAGPLRYDEARRMADMVADLSGHESLQRVSELLALEVEDQDLINLPAAGPAIVVANHPTGLADGIAVYDSLSRRRADMRFLVNSDALRVAPGLIDVMIPIQLGAARGNRRAARLAFGHLEEAVRAGQILVVFPSGRLAYLSPFGIRERTWLPSVLGIARRHRLPIVPLNIRARNSPIFYLFSLMSQELRDVTLFRELLNKHRHRFRMVYGPPLLASDLPSDPQRAIAQLQHEVERLLPMRAEARLWDPQPTPWRA